MAEQVLSRDRDEQSMGELVRQLSDQTTALVRAEVELAKAELAGKGKQAGMAPACSAAPGCRPVRLRRADRGRDPRPRHCHRRVAGGADRRRACTPPLAGVLVALRQEEGQQATPPVPERAVDTSRKTSTWTSSARRKAGDERAGQTTARATRAAPSARSSRRARSWATPSRRWPRRPTSRRRRARTWRMSRSACTEATRTPRVRPPPRRRTRRARTRSRSPSSAPRPGALGRLAHREAVGPAREQCPGATRGSDHAVTRLTSTAPREPTQLGARAWWRRPQAHLPRVQRGQPHRLGGGADLLRHALDLPGAARRSCRFSG